jgi:hypothetical protein
MYSTTTTIVTPTLVRLLYVFIITHFTIGKVNRAREYQLPLIVSSLVQRVRTKPKTVCHNQYHRRQEAQITREKQRCRGGDEGEDGSDDRE